MGFEKWKLEAGRRKEEAGRLKLGVGHLLAAKLAAGFGAWRAHTAASVREQPWLRCDCPSPITKPCDGF